MQEFPLRNQKRKKEEEKNSPQEVCLDSILACAIAYFRQLTLFLAVIEEAQTWSLITRYSSAKELQGQVPHRQESTKVSFGALFEL